MSYLIERLRRGEKNIPNHVMGLAADRIAELEASFGCVLEGGHLKVARLEQEVARLTTHIRAIAEHHDAVTKLIQSNFDGRLLEGEVDYEHAYHTERRDFALSGLEGK